MLNSNEKLSQLNKDEKESLGIKVDKDLEQPEMIIVTFGAGTGGCMRCE